LFISSAQERNCCVGRAVVNTQSVFFYYGPAGKNSFWHRSEFFVLFLRSKKRPARFADNFFRIFQIKQRGLDSENFILRQIVVNRPKNQKPAFFCLDRSGSDLFLAKMSIGSMFVKNALA
jgi:hypothetical protein